MGCPPGQRGLFIVFEQTLGTQLALTKQQGRGVYVQVGAPHCCNPPELLLSTYRHTDEWCFYPVPLCCAIGDCQYNPPHVLFRKGQQRLQDNRAVLNKRCRKHNVCALKARRACFTHGGVGMVHHVITQC